MAFGDIGYSAMDALRPAAGSGGNGTPGKVSGATPQQAVKVLSLRIPERAAQGSIAPLPLLTGQGSATPGASAFTSLIAQLANSFKPQLPSAAPQVPVLNQPGPTPTSGAQPVPVPSLGDSDSPTIWNVPRDPDNPRPPVIPEPYQQQGPVQGPTPQKPTPPSGNPPPPVFTFPVDPTPPVAPEPKQPEDDYRPVDVTPPSLFEEPAPASPWDYIPDYKRGLFDDYGW